ncbi:MAG: aminoacyl-tRNA hydrolase [Syntrophomonadaceae bacterium]|nr:aminoacyl-tRNA hydrolase [Syntrophomonadaceae bacterium]
MKIVVGLGNPGREYGNTRHNVGFMVVEELARRHNVEKEENRFDAVIAHLRIAGEKVLLAKPLTYMNLSGRAVKPLVNCYKADVADLMVVFDDMDIEPGDLRIRPAGGAGGHKGMESITEKLGTQGFPRLRVGIGRPQGDAVDWVLGEFTDEEKILMQQTIKKAADAIECWVKRGIDAAMNTYN